MTPFETFSLVGLIGMPALALMLTRQDKHREAHFCNMREKVAAVAAQLTHLDECIEKLKERMLGTMATRGDLSENQVEVRQMIARQAEISAQDTNGLHKRMMRLEDLALSHHPGEKA